RMTASPEGRDRAIPAHTHRPSGHRKRRVNRGSTQHRGCNELDIDWMHFPRIPPGEYAAISRRAVRYFDNQFQRWVCAVQFDIVSDSLAMETIAPLMWFLNLGSRAKPYASRRGRFWAALVRANGGPPKRGDRLTLRVFEGRLATVRVEDT